MNLRSIVSKQILAVVYTVAVLALPVLLVAHEKGPDPRKTAAPGDADQFACATAGCHTAFKNSGGGPVNAYGGSATATFSQGSSFTPGGDPISILVRVSDPVNSKYGFQMTARPVSDLRQGQAGTFKPGTGQFVLCDNDSPRFTRCPTDAPIEYVEHSVPSTTTFAFTWTPAASDNSPVRFYLAGNAVNGNGHEDADDHVYTNDFTLAPYSACTAATPVIDGIISAGAFGARRDFGPGSWLEIYGSNFSTANKEWQGTDFNGIIAPTLLDRTKVTVNGKPAFVWFITPGQLNVLAPDDTKTGPVEVTVSNCDKTSAPALLTSAAVAPGLLAPPAFLVSGKQYLAATLTDLKTFVGTIPNVTSRPVKPGETIITYGVGFGPTVQIGTTSPVLPAGSIAAVANKLVDPVTVTIGGVQVPAADIGYAGLAPGFVGLYQFNLVVPNVPDGDQAITFKIGSVTVPQTLFISVKK